MSPQLRTRNEILKSRAEIPQNVVSRSFASETVVLNLNTGKYHGLNPSAGYMFELLTKLGSVEQSAVALAEQYGLSPEEAADDLCDFCVELEQRSLIVLHAADAA